LTVTEGTNAVVASDPPRVVDAARCMLGERVPTRRPELWNARFTERIGEVLTARR
jgi:UDP-N-acetylglucosamine 2-epimerase (non-hydrolysing)